MNDDAFKDENPFAKLNKKAFPDARGKNTAVHRASVLKAVQDDIPDIFPDDDTALFLHAVGNIAPIAAAWNNRSDRQGFGHTLSLPKKAAEQSAHISAPHTEVPSSEGSSAEPNFAELFAQSFSKDASFHSQKKQEKTQRAGIPQSTPAENTHKEIEEEIGLFADAVRDVAPLSRKGRAVAPDTPPVPVTPPTPQHPLQDFMDGKVEFALSSTDEYVEAHVVGLDLAIVGKLQNGQFSPEANIDLHGLNSKQAFEALVGFIRNAYMCGRRTVLVVSGRGKNSPAGIGVLREKLQSWFVQEPFRRVVLAFCTAKSADGGPGALYVLLRKFRKDKGKVYWDHRPVDPDLCL